MRLLLDQNMPLSLVEILGGHDVEHVALLDIVGASDDVVLARARADQRVLVTLDLDFIQPEPQPGEPSIVLVRVPAPMRANLIARAIVDGLALLAADDERGALVVVEPGRVRIRRAPDL